MNWGCGRVLQPEWTQASCAALMNQTALKYHLPAWHFMPCSHFSISPCRRRIPLHYKSRVLLKCGTRKAKVGLLHRIHFAEHKFSNFVYPCLLLLTSCYPLLIIFSSIFLVQEKSFPSPPKKKVSFPIKSLSVG